MTKKEAIMIIADQDNGNPAEIVAATEYLMSLEERKTGKWIPHPSYRMIDVCSSCRIGCQRRNYSINPDGTEYVEEVSYQYCPWCGAKMEVD